MLPRAMLRLVEIFNSIQGEGTHAGLPCAFVRLAACNLRCGYCDTPYSFGKGDEKSTAAIVAQVESYGVRHVCITGGEPMLQANAANDLMATFIDRGYTVLLETNGTISLADVPAPVVKVMDIKTPDGLGMRPDDARFVKMHLDYNNLNHLTPRDEVKFVITSRADYEWSKAFVLEHNLNARCGQVLFSPSWSDIEASQLAAWLLEDQLPVRLNLQLHKYVWGPDATGG